MGFVGSMMQTIFKGLFGGLSIFIPFIIVATGILGFFDGNEYIYRIKNTKMYYLTIAFIFVFQTSKNKERYWSILVSWKKSIRL